MLINNTKFLKTIEYFFLITIFFTLIFGRMFMGLGIDQIRVTTVIHILGFVLYIFILLSKLKKKQFYEDKVLIFQTIAIVYLIIYYFNILIDLNNAETIVTKLRHSTVYFFGIWYLIGKNLLKLSSLKFYKILLVVSITVQFFSPYILQLINLDNISSYSDKGNEIYSVNIISISFLIISSIYLYSNISRIKVNNIFYILLFLLPSILSGSRGTFIATIISCFFLFNFIKNKFLFNKIFLLYSFIFLFLGFLLVPDSAEDLKFDNNFQEVLLNPFLKEDRNNFVDLNNPDENIVYRIEVWKNISSFSVNNGLKNFLFGQNYETTHTAQIEVNKIYTTSNILKPEYPHNFVIFLLGKFGFVGLIIFLCIIFTIYINLKKEKKLYLLCLILFILFDGLFDPVFLSTYYSFLVFTNLGILFNHN